MSAGRILVVDDNPTNLKLVTDLLECEGFEVHKAIDAQEAQQLIESVHPELVLLDIALPGMDGLELTKKLKANPRTKDLIIVALTAFAMRGDEDRAKEVGCDGYVTKPINTRTLPALIAGFLPKAKRLKEEDELDILIIEDTASELKLAQHILQSAGHNVSCAEAFEEAIQVIRKGKPQLILLDLVLPGMNGLEIVRRLKTDPETSEIRVLAITSYPELFSEAQAKAAGCDAYLVKPVDTKNLSKNLEDLNKRSQTPDGP